MRVRLALASLSGAVALAALAVGGVDTWRDLGHDHAHLSAHDAALAAPRREHLPVALFAAWRARLHAGDRWWIAAPPGAATGLTNRRAVYRAYATFDFLPAVPAESRSDATVVFGLRAAR